MANGYIKAAQIIADDQTEVATKLQTLLDAEGIDASELNDFEVTTFGANKFLISILYAALRSIGNLSSKAGLKALAPKVKLGVSKTLTTIIGVKSSFVDLWKFFRKLSTKVGLTATVFFKLGTKLSTKVGLKTVAPLHSSPFINRALSTKLGFALVLDYYNHVINPVSTLSTKTGLKASGQAFYNGVLPNIPIG